ncbi:hypothetical protein BGZ58_010903 [Dissophora ornata]|nr:hypothetical protein BGZ58_010903 [Dissophora ornata]
MPAHARQLLRSSSQAGNAFPRNPVFFSTTARQFSNTPPLTQGSDSTTTPIQPTAETVVEPTENTEQAPTPTPTNLGNLPESITCTVSPPSTYAFLKPTPVVLLTGPFGGNWCFRDTWQTSLADQGYQSTSIELNMPHQRLESGDAYIRHFVKVLKTSIETDHSFYPPILIAHGLHALVAQKYVESNPVSALVLVSPFIPELVKSRFQDLSAKLLRIKAKKESSKTGETTSSSETATSKSSSSSSSVEPLVTATATELKEFNFETHADVLAQEGFRETFVLPKKAVYKIDQVAKELQEKEKEKEKEKERKEEEMLQIMEEETELMKQAAQVKTDSAGSSKDEVNITSNSAQSAKAEAERFGRDSVPVWEAGSPMEEDAAEELLKDATGDVLPVQTVESEASVPSPLEQLPLAIYDSIPTSVFEPNFPILLVTSNGDEIVSTADVKDHHILAGQVDHIELEDLDDGGHLIMVSDYTEWEQGIEGITAWLDSNGM